MGANSAADTKRLAISGRRCQMDERSYPQIFLWNDDDDGCRCGGHENIDSCGNGGGVIRDGDGDGFETFDMAMPMVPMMEIVIVMEKRRNERE